MPRARARRRPTLTSARVLTTSVALAALLACAPAHAADPPPAKPDAVALAQAKTHFTAGLKLYKEGSVREALAEFLVANRIVPRASVLKNIAQCYRDLRDFTTAHAKYGELLTTYGAAMKPAESDEVKRVLAELGALTGTVTVKVAEPGATVTIDDRDAGATPLAAPVRLNLGAHTVVIAKAGFDTLTRKLDIQGGEDVAIEASLVKEVTTGHLAITASGADASVRLKIDGREVGPPPWEGDLPPGPHEISADGDAARAAPQRVELARAARIELPLALKLRTGHVLIDPHQTDAQIKVDGAVVATGIWEGDLKIGRHDMTIDAPGFLTYTRALLVHDDERIAESAALKPKARDERLDYVGMYGGVTVGATVSPSTNEYAEMCQNGASGCSGNHPAIGAVNDYANIGYSFGVLALEAVALFRLDLTSADVDFPADAGGGRTGPARTEHLDMTRFIYGAGLGGRITTKGSIARFTFGTSLLVAQERVKGTVQFDSKSSPINCGNNNGGGSSGSSNGGCNNSVDESASKTAPAILLDGGLMLGSTPGVRFKLGMVALFGFFGDVVANSPASLDASVCTTNKTGPGGQTCSNATFGIPALRFAQGTQWFVGPVLGLQFGH